jgi:hypothetical protein
MGWLAFGLTLLFVKETYAPAILVSKAATLRRQTRNWGIHAKQDEVELDLHELLTTNFSRPLRMLFTEPIVMAVTVYMSFIYGLMYALLDAYPIVFQEIHGMNEGVGGLPFIGLIVGEFAGGLYILWGQKEYVRKLVANGGVPVPEWRLWPAVVGGVFFTIGLFWYVSSLSSTLLLLTKPGSGGQATHAQSTGSHPRSQDSSSASAYCASSCNASTTSSTPTYNSPPPSSLQTPSCVP